VPKSTDVALFEYYWIAGKAEVLHHLVNGKAIPDGFVERVLILLGVRRRQDGDRMGKCSGRPVPLVVTEPRLIIRPNDQYRDVCNLLELVRMRPISTCE
jgi:hypothetical protein